jgi:ribonuclease HI
MLIIFNAKDPTRTKEITYARGIGALTINEVEYLVVLQGLSILMDKKVDNAIVIRDSSFIIKALHLNNPPKNFNLHLLVQRILQVVQDKKKTSSMFCDDKIISLMNKPTKEWGWWKEYLF